jgi:hypothetical protein
MTRKVVTSTVGSDGVLHLDVPLGAPQANSQVQVTVEPILKKPMTREQWRTWVQSMAGSITDESFERPSQGEYEARETLP